MHLYCEDLKFFDEIFSEVVSPIWTDWRNWNVIVM